MDSLFTEYKLTFPSPSPLLLWGSFSWLSEMLSPWPQFSLHQIKLNLHLSCCAFCTVNGRLWYRFKSLTSIEKCLEIWSSSSSSYLEGDTLTNGDFPYKSKCFLPKDFQSFSHVCCFLGFPGVQRVKETPACQCRRHKSMGSILGSRKRSPGEGNSSLMQYSCHRKFHRDRSLADLHTHTLHITLHYILTHTHMLFPRK